MPISIPSQYDDKTEVMWFICPQKEPSWDQERFLHEYGTVHADLVRVGHQHTGMPLRYIQAGARDLMDLNNPSGDDGMWDSVASLYWPSMRAIWECIRSPGYRETAGKHFFCRQDQKGLLAKRLGALGLTTPNVPEDADYLIHIFHRRGAPGDAVSAAWLEERTALVRASMSRDPVKQYSIWEDITPADTDAFFEDTQFSRGSWRQFTAVERFVFGTRGEALEFYSATRQQLVVSPDSTYVVGGLASVVI